MSQATISSFYTPPLASPKGKEAPSLFGRAVGWIEKALLTLQTTKPLILAEILPASSPLPDIPLRAERLARLAARVKEELSLQRSEYLSKLVYNPLATEFIKLHRRNLHEAWESLENDHLKVAILLQLAADPRSFDQFLSDVPEIGIKDLPILFYLMKKIGSHNRASHAVARHIGKFSVEEEDTRVKIACRLSLEAVAYYIQNFDFSAEENRLFIARRCIERGVGKIVASSINHFAITSEANRLDLALTLIEDGEAFTVAKNFPLFAISMEADRLFCLNKILDNCDASIAIYIHNFAIDNENCRKAIAEKLIDSDCEEIVCDYFPQFNITREEDRLSLAQRIIARGHEEAVICNIGRFVITERIKHISLLLLALINLCQKDLPYEIFVEKLKDYLNPLSHFRAYLADLSSFPLLEETLKALDNDILSAEESTKKTFLEDQKTFQLFLWGAAIAALKSLHLGDTKYLLEIQKTVIKIASYKNKAIAAKLMQVYVEKILPRKLALYYEAFAPAAHLALPMIFVASWEESEKGSSAEAFQSFFNTKERRYILRDARHGHLQNLLQVCVTFENTPFLTAAEKLHLIGLICTVEETASPLTEKDVFKRIVLVQALINLGFGSIFKTITPSLLLTKHLENEILHALQHAGLLDHSTIDNFAHKYAATFGSMRRENAFLIYASHIQDLEDPFVKRIFSLFVTSVLNGTFWEERYKPTNSPHLIHIAKSHPKIYEAWRQSLPPRSFLTESDASLASEDVFIAEDSDHWQDFLLLGTEVEGSCLRIDGNPEKSKCILAGLDGKNRIITVKNSEGKMRARAFLRLMWDTEKKSPALFMERIYPRSVSEIQEEALLDLALRRADTLKVPLFTLNNGKNLGPTRELQSHGSLAPYEYVDAHNLGVVIEGRFTIFAREVLSTVKTV